MPENVVDNKLIYDRAKAAVLSRDYNLASRLYKNLLKSDPSNVELLSALGSIYQKSGRDADAIPLYKQIVSTSPNNVEALNNLGSIYRRIKKYGDSIAYLEQAVIADENNVQTFYNLGFTYKLMGKYDDALKCFESVVEEKPEDVLAYNHLGSIYDMLGKNDLAVSSYLRGLKVDANHPILHLNLAKTYVRMNRLELAASEFEAALRSKPGWLEAIDAYADLLLKKDETKDAANILNQAISLNPQNPKMHAKMGDVYSKQEIYEDAEHEYNTALKYDSSNIKILSSLADAYEMDGKSMEAVQTMERYEQLAPEDLSMTKQYAKVLLTANKLKSAKEKIRKLWDKNSHDVQTINLLGQYYICHGDDSRAESCFKRIEQIDPSYKDFYKDFGHRYHQNGNFEKAEKNLKQYLDSNPEDANAISMLASSLENLNKFSDALKAYKKLSKKHSGNSAYSEKVKDIKEKIEKQGTIQLDSSEEYQAEVEDKELNEQLPEEASNLSKDKEDPVENNASQRVSHPFTEGLSFEKLTLDDETSPSPFDKTLDDEILASKSSQADLDTLVPQDTDFGEEEDFFESNPFGSPSTGPQRGPVEEAFENAFEDEDIGNTDARPSSFVDVKDGFSDEEDDDFDNDDFFFDDEEDDEDDEGDVVEPVNKKPKKRAPEPQPPLEEIFDDDSPEEESEEEFENFPEDESFGEERLRFPKDDIDDEIDIEPVPEEKFELPEEEPENHPAGLPEIPDTDSGDFDFPEIEDVTPKAESTDDDFGIPVEDVTPKAGSADDDFGIPVEDVTSKAESADDDFGIPVEDVTPKAGSTDDDFGIPVEDVTPKAESADDDFGIPVEDVTPKAEETDDDFDFPVDEYIAPENPETEVLNLPTDDGLDLAADASDSEYSEEDSEEVDNMLNLIDEKSVDAGDTEAIINEVPVQVNEDDFVEAEEEPEETSLSNSESFSEYSSPVESEDFDVPLDETLISEEPDIGDEEMMAAAIKNSALDYSLLNKTASTLSTFMDMIQNKDFAQKYKQTAKLFEELKSLSNYLPEEKKDEFLLSKAHLQLEYILKRLKGAVGLLSAAEHLRNEWGVDSGLGSQDAASKSGRALVTTVFTYMRTLISSLPEKKLATILDGEVSRILNKLS